MLYLGLLRLTAITHLLNSRKDKLFFYLRSLLPTSFDLSLVHLNHFLVVEVLFFASIGTRVARALCLRLLVGVVTVIPEE